MQRIWQCILLCGLLANLPLPASAHSFWVFLSTPMSPPQGFWWVAVLTAVLLCAVFTRHFMRVGGLSRWHALARSLGIVAVYAVLLLVVGFLATMASTAPPPGLGWGARVFWGTGWDYFPLFAIWNFIGLLLLLLCVTVLGKTPRRADKVGCVLLGVCAFAFPLFFGEGGIVLLVLLGIAAVIYALATRPAELIPVAASSAAVYGLCLLPYLLTGALAGGSEGGYGGMNCARNIRTMGAALIVYAKEHQDRLPSDGSFADLRATVSELPSFQSDREYRFPVHICPTLRRYERNPRPYYWNAAFAGKTIAEVRKAGHVPLLSCPYHRPKIERDYHGIVLYADDFVQVYDATPAKKTFSDYSNALYDCIE